ncbi:MAG: butyrate kinase [Bacteroidales bacterium]|nr:butyrate kinase [Bacteroidales bacterium]
MERLILAVNPGSTSTKFGLYSDDKIVFDSTIRHSSEKLSGFGRISEQLSFRKELIIKELEKHDIDIKKISVVVGRGGLLKPIESGVYQVNQQMLKELERAERGEHASNLGGLIAAEIAGDISGALAFIVDPVVVDELDDVARLSGHPLLQRISIFHALNQKAVARSYAESINKEYEDLNLIVAHMGGGISVGAHVKGRVVDVNNALNGEGPFSPERSGTLPVGQLVKLCFSGEYSEREVMKMINGNGGMVAYLDTNNFKEICEKADSGDRMAKLVKEASSYQVAKEIAACAAVMRGEVDAIILTGGMAYEDSHNEFIREMVGFIANVVIYPGEDELQALAHSGFLALDKKVKIKEYR